MGKVCLVLMLLVPFYVYADPRMETNDNFCHFVHNNVDDDDETFAAGCDSVISVEQGSANGHGRVVKQLPVGFLNFDVPVSESNLTAPQYTCTMVESNGTAYASNEWVSTITATPKYDYRHRKSSRKWHREVVGYTVVYEVTCKNGAAN